MGSLIFGLDLLSTLNPFKEVAIDDWYDQLNRSFMFGLTVLLAFAMTAAAASGKTIACTGFEKFEKSFSEDYCWTQGLYTVAEAYHYSRDVIPYPGVAPANMPAKCLSPDAAGSYESGILPDPEDLVNCGGDFTQTRVFHLWYQWVTPYLWMVAGSFYFPYLVYKRYGFEIKPLLKILNDTQYRDNEEELEGKVDRASVWLYHRLAVCISKTPGPGMSLIRRHGVGLLFIAIKISYLATSCIIMWTTSLMFELADFKLFGWVWAAKQWPDPPGNTTSIKDLLFPKMVACQIKRWGTTGLEVEHGMCVLARNVMHQYIFLILWWALAAMIVVNVFNVIAGLINVFFRQGSYQQMLARTFCRHKAAYKLVYDNIGTNGRIMITMLMTNSSPVSFEKIMDRICPRLVENCLDDGKRR